MTEHSETDITIKWDPDGHRIVSWPAGIDPDGTPRRISHRAPDAVSHWYKPPESEEDLLLYRGPFKLEGQDDPYHGHICFSWFPKPEVVADGIGAEEEHLEKLFSDLKQPQKKIWTSLPKVTIDLSENGSLPPQPTQPAELILESGNVQISQEINSEIGQTHALDEVTFLVPNGWRGGVLICDKEDLSRVWHGRTEASGDGWIVTFDREASISDKHWKELRKKGRRFTHVGRLAREDGSEFSSEEVPAVLDRLRIGLNLALGRRTACALPVGWKEGRPVWAYWSSFRATDYRPPTHWPHPLNAHHEVGSIVSHMLEFTKNREDHLLMRNAIGYYTAAVSEVGVEIRSSVATSGLQLLAYRKLMHPSDRKYSKSAWNALRAEGELRKLAELFSMDTNVPARMKYLHEVRQNLENEYKSKNPDKPRSDPFDALFVLIKMRNIATHPGEDQHHDLDMNSWAEIGLLAGYWLGCAALHVIKHEGPLKKPFWE